MSKLAPETQFLCHTDHQGRKRPLPLFWILTALAAMALFLAYTEQLHEDLASASLMVTIALSIFLFRKI